MLSTTCKALTEKSGSFIQVFTVTLRYIKRKIEAGNINMTKNLLSDQNWMSGKICKGVGWEC